MGEKEELMRRFIAQRSRIDQVSAWWVEKRLWKKILYIIGFNLSAGLLGLLINVTLPFMLGAGLLSLTLHWLLSSHEQNRRTGGKILIEETTELNKNLKAREQIFKEATNKLLSDNNKVQQQSNKLEEEATSLNFKLQLYTLKNEVIEEIQKQTADLLTQEKMVHDHLKVASSGLEGYEKYSSITAEKKSQLLAGEAFSQFSSAVQDIAQSQKAFSNTANRYLFFANEQGLSNRSENLKTRNWLNELKKEIAEKERLMERWGQKASSH